MNQGFIKFNEFLRLKAREECKHSTATIATFIVDDFVETDLLISEMT